jgi:uncharacterized protein
MGESARIPSCRNKSTHIRATEPLADAWAQVMAWLACDTTWIPEPTEHHSETLDRLIALPGVHGNLVPDAHVAALAIEHGVTLCSTDGDFGRFPGLRWLNPLAA